MSRRLFLFLNQLQWIPRSFLAKMTLQKSIIDEPLTTYLYPKGTHMLQSKQYDNEQNLSAKYSRFTSVKINGIGVNPGSKMLFLLYKNANE